MRRLTILGICGALAMMVAAMSVLSCKQSPIGSPGQKKLAVVASLFPLYDFARQIGGEQAEVSLLLPPGVEAHAFEPKPGDMARISNADLFLYTGREMEPWVEDVRKSIASKKLIVVDTSSGIALHEAHEDEGHGGEKDSHGHGRLDPHVWLDFAKAQQMVDTITKGFTEADPGRQTLYAGRAVLLKAALADLDKRYQSALSTCRKKTFIHGGHYAFGYLARRYNLHYLSAYEGSPNAEPTPQKLIELRETMRRLGIRYVYYEELVTPRTAEVLAKEAGATLLRLHGAHNISRDDLSRGVTFLSLMEENLRNLVTGLECT